MSKTTIKIKQGATTIYAVIFVIIIITILVIGFVRLILADQTSTTNADLAQSAYDSALVGVEDAKLSILQYRNCRGKADNEVVEGNALTCREIRDLMSQVSLANDRCDLVSSILGRTTVNGETPVQESTSTQAALDTSQAYTCVKMAFSLPDYRASLNSDNSVQVVPLEGGAMNDIKSINIHWYSDNDGTTYNYNNTDNSGNIIFPSTNEYGGMAVPPVLSVQLIQADNVFDLGDFEYSHARHTDRGTVILVPADGSGSNTFDDKFTKANDKTIMNEPLLVNCPMEHDTEFICNAKMNIPTPVQSRNDPEGDNIKRKYAFLVLSLPYNQPATSFSIEMLDANDNVIYFEGVQAAVDSTGRANDLFSRVEARIATSDTYFPYPTYGVQLNGSGPILEKNFYIAPYCHTTSSGRTSSCDTTGTPN